LPELKSFWELVWASAGSQLERNIPFVRPPNAGKSRAQMFDHRLGACLQDLAQIALARQCHADVYRQLR
jgi:hypothetical protein